MKSLKDFDKELNKCSKCGLCESVCPIFKLNKNDCAVSKGKFIMLQGIINGDLKPSKNIEKYLDMCLKCGKCSDFCPSGIDAVQIFNIAKSEYTNKTLYGKLLKFVHKFVRPFTRTKNSKTSTDKSKINVVYFKGCVNNIFPNTDKYLRKILNNSSLNIITPAFECCGLPYLSEGNIEGFEQAARHNLSLLKNDFDYLVTDCASCQSTLEDYTKYIDNGFIPTQKMKNWGDIIAEQDLKFEFKNPQKVTFHKPCHLKNDDFFKKIIKNCSNTEYIKMENYDDCCGCAGTFILKNYNISKELSRIKARNIIHTEADCVITTCPACLIGLKHGLSIYNSKIKVMSLLEFLANANTIYS